MEGKENELEINKNKTLSEIISSQEDLSIEKKDSNNSSENEIIKLKDPEKIISDLQQKIFLLEKKNNDLKSKNENLTKNNTEKTALMMKISLANMRRKFPISQIQDKSLQLAEITKEKDDLQKINEKMLDLLTDKEIENEDLVEKLENNRLEAKLETEKYLEKIKNLEEKIQELENSKGNEGNYNDIDSIVHEYNIYKERLKMQINEYIRNEGNLKHQLDRKDMAIQRLNEEIQGLQEENLQLVNQSKRNDKLNESEMIEIDNLKSENDKIKRQLSILEDKLRIAEENTKNEIKNHDNDINQFHKKLVEEENYLKLYKENKAKEINLLKNEITKNKREIDYFFKRIELYVKMLDDEKLKNSEIQNKLDKKSKELQSMNEYTKKLLSNKDNLLTQYEETIEKITNDKNELISQNKELLEKIKSKNDQNNAGLSLEEIINEDEKNNNNREELQHFIQENKLLNEEIKGLKEQLSIQAKELIDLNSFEKEIVKLKAENEILTNNNKEINKKLEEQKKKEEEELLEKKKTQLINAIKSLKKKSVLKSENDKINYEKQIEALKKLKEEEKNDYEQQLKKLKLEIALIKLQNMKHHLKKDKILNNYKNIVKTASNQYIRKYGIFFICAIIILILAIKKF